MLEDTLLSKKGETTERKLTRLGKSTSTLEDSLKARLLALEKSRIEDRLQALEAIGVEQAFQEANRRITSIEDTCKTSSVVNLPSGVIYKLECTIGKSCIETSILSATCILDEGAA